MQKKDLIAEVIENMGYENIKDPIAREVKVRINHSDFIAKEILARLNRSSK